MDTRAGLLLILSIGLSMIFTGILIPILKKKHVGQPIREEGNKDHYSKAGTPTMGALAFLLAAIILIIAKIGFSFETGMVLLAILVFAGIGFIDDFEKVLKKDNLGLTASQKLVLQIGLSFILSLILYFFGDLELPIQYLPFKKTPVDISLWSIPLVTLIFVSTTNAVNLTDGLDGLLSSVSIPIFFGLYLVNRFTDPKLAQTCLVLAGVLLGFLVFNSNPASVFMGDTGSMALGGALAMVLVLMSRGVFLLIIGGIFVVEALSVIIQVISFQTRGKRIFKMSPIHHHFELEGYKESKIVAAFMVVSVMLTAFSLYIMGM